MAKPKPPPKITSQSTGVIIELIKRERSRIKRLSSRRHNAAIPLNSLILSSPSF